MCVWAENKNNTTTTTTTARGFGMRVVGGKTGADGRLFAYIVWTVPGGPAEKGGLQQGDKVIFLSDFNYITSAIPLVFVSFEYSMFLHCK